MLTVSLSSTPNTDFPPGLRGPKIAPVRVSVASLDEASAKCREFIATHDLGGGNWTGGQVYRGDEQVARVSYNGRIWSV